MLETLSPRMAATLLAVVLFFGLAPAPAQPGGAPAAQGRRYPWTRRLAGYEPLAARFAPPAGFARLAAPPGSFAEWLRGLPLLPAGSPVRAYDGRVLRGGDHPTLAAVVDLDLSRHDRQQCADSIIRLRGEYLRAAGRADEASFLWAGGQRFAYRDWRRGLRPVRHGRRWTLEPRARPSSGYVSYRAYLEYLFSWTGTLHLSGEPRARPETVQPGDFFIQGGSPGHAVIILDLARDRAGRRRALLGQGYMPAQDLHVLRADDGSPWFELAPPRPLRTPFWRPFAWTDLRRFR